MKTMINNLYNKEYMICLLLIILLVIVCKSILYRISMKVDHRVPAKTLSYRIAELIASIFIGAVYLAIGIPLIIFSLNVLIKPSISILNSDSLIRIFIYTLGGFSGYVLIILGLLFTLIGVVTVIHYIWRSLLFPITISGDSVEDEEGYKTL